MVNLDKYENDGWGLSRKEFELLYELLKKVDSQNEYNVVEFGSGRSTEFLIDSMNDLKLNIKIHSFDDSTEYAFKGEHENLKLMIQPLVECDDNVFDEMFKNKEYDRSKMRHKITPVHTRQKNTFYLINPAFLPPKIDLLIVDGPHGNGRSIGFLHCFKKFVNGSMILIDDASHYPFYYNLSKLIETEIVYEQHIKHDKWNNGGDFILCKVTQ